jgi:hypothetical protein
MDVTKRDISHFEVCSNRRIAVAVFSVCIFIANGNVRFAPAESCRKNALSCYTRFTQYWIYTGSGFAFLDNSFVEIQRLFDNTPDDFALW